MPRQRVLLYFLAVVTMIVVATVMGEAFVIARIIEHARRADLRFAAGAAHHVATTLAEEQRYLEGLLDRIPMEEGDAAVREYLRHLSPSTFERDGISVYTANSASVGGELAPGGMPPRQMLLPALRIARQTGALSVTSTWHGLDGRPRFSLVVAKKGVGTQWRAAVGNVLLDDKPFLSRFGFASQDDDVRLQILDAAGVALFSTHPAERYRSVVHGTYLVDFVRQGQSTQLKCHACHEGPGGQPTRQDEVSTLAPVPGTPWSVLVRENPRRVQQVMAEVMIIVVSLACLILGTFAGFYWLLARRVLTPLRQLANAAATISAATPTSAPPSAGFDELTPSNAMPALVQEPAAPPDIEESLRRALTTAVNNFRNIELLSFIGVVLEGELLRGGPLIVGTRGDDTAALTKALKLASRGRERVGVDELVAAGVAPELLGSIDSVYRSALHPTGALRGDVWVATANPETARHLRPISILITLQVQGLVDRNLLSDTLWHEYSEKNRLLGHLFEAEATERKRIAQDIHDDTAQSLTALLFLLEAFPVGADADKQAKAIKTVQECVRSIMDSTNRIMKRLRPALLDDLGLVDAVNKLGDDVLTSAGIDFELDSDEDLRAAPVIEDAIFRVFQEAANNVVHHAKATLVQAHLGRSGDEIVAWFEDNGRGMRSPTQESLQERPRFGLLGMRERITQLGGKFRVSVASSGGVRIDLSLPYRARNTVATTPEGHST